MARKYLGRSGERLTVWISIAASTVLIFYGYDQGVFGNVIINENFLHTFGYPSANMQGVMTSIYNIGCFIGAMSTVWTGDILGRPRQILLGSTIIAIGAIIQTCSWTVASMMVGRIVAGLGTGMNTSTAGVWQAETSKMSSRGKLVIIQMGMLIFPEPMESEPWRLTMPSKLHHRFQYFQLAHTWLFIRTARCRVALPSRLPTLLHILHLCHVPISTRLASSLDPQGKARKSTRSFGCTRRAWRNAGVASCHHPIQYHQGHSRSRACEYIYLVAACLRKGAQRRSAKDDSWRVDAGHEPSRWSMGIEHKRKLIVNARFPALTSPLTT